MKLSSNQRKFLETMAIHLDPIVRIGKLGMEAKIVNSVKDAFNKHELIKIKILESAPVEKQEVVDILIKETKASLIRIIGRVIILYKGFENKAKKIELPAPKNA